MGLRLWAYAKSVLASLQILALVIGTIWSPVAFAVEVELSRSMQFQMIDNDSREATGVLRAGSRVDVPEKFEVRNASGGVDKELSLNNWLRVAGRTGYAEPSRGGGLLAKTQGSLDFYYPIKILNAAEGSTVPKYKGRVYFLALRMLTRQNGELKTRQDTRPQTEDESGEDDAVEPVPTPPKREALEAMGTCPGGVCSPRSQSTQFDLLISTLGPALRRAQVRADLTKRRTAVDMKELAASFQRSCGFSLKSFLPIVKDETKRAGVPTEIMLAMMVQESSGRCYSAGHNDNGTRDSGLFGVNSATAHMRRCDTNEISWMRRAQPSQLEGGPRCIENPVVNLQVSLKIMKSKMGVLTALPFEARRMKDQQGRFTPDAWRMAASAYNGGEKWVLLAKADLAAFNRKNGTSLNQYAWEDLRVFYLRAYLSEGQQNHFIGRVRTGRQSSAVMNLAYAENLIPRDPSIEGASATMAAGEVWRRQLARNP